MTVQLPPGRTIEEQREINNQILDVCGVGNGECATEMGYIPISPRLPAPGENVLESSIITLVCIVLGLGLVVVKAMVFTTGGRWAYRRVTR